MAEAWRSVVDVVKSSGLSREVRARNERLMKHDPLHSIATFINLSETIELCRKVEYSSATRIFWKKSCESRNAFQSYLSMSNCEVVDLPVLEVEPHQVSEVLRCILHTIIFNRSLGTVQPREIDSDLFDLTWAHCGDTSVDSLVESKISSAKSWIDRNPGRKSVQVSLSFFERLRQQSTSWLSLRQEQRLYWEQWRIYLSLEDFSTENDAARDKRKSILENKLTDCLITIISTVNEKREHIPAVTSASSLTYPFEVTVESAHSGNSSSIFGVDVVRRMLSSAQPPSVLH